MESWYALKTIEKREQEAKELLEHFVERSLWSCTAIPRKTKVFRSGGMLHLVSDVMFPGYLFIRTGQPKLLSEALGRSRELPKLVNGNGRRVEEEFIPLEEADLQFLQTACGETLQKTMGVTDLILGENNRILEADGILGHYLDRIVRLNLHKRFAVVEVPLFNRMQPVLFGIRLAQDRAV